MSRDASSPSSFTRCCSVLSVLLSLVAGGCGSEDTTAVNTAPDNGEQPPSGDAPADGQPEVVPPSGSDPVVMVMNRVCTPEGCNHYMYALPELPADRVLDRSGGIELGDTQAAVYDGVPYVFDRFNQSVTRWALDAQGVLRPAQTVSFQSAGVTQLDAIGNVFVSPTRAYVLDSAARVLVTWDPTAMEIRGITGLPDDIASRDGAPFSGLWPISGGGRVYYAASWYDYDNRRGYEKAALLTFDATEDQPSFTVIEDARCGITSSVAPFADERGDVYFAGDWGIGQNQIGVLTGRATKPACMLRVPAGTTSVDPDYYVDLLEAADARAITAAFYLGNGRWLMNVWPSSVPALTEAEIQADPDAYLGAKNFEYVVIADLVTKTRIPVTGLARGTYGGLTPMYMDGTLYVQVFPPDSATTGTALYEIKPTGEARHVLSAGPNGDFEFLGRLR